MSLPERWSLEGPSGAPVVVLANSLGTTAAMWDGVAPALLARHRVLRYEHPGHGRAAAPAPTPTTVAALAAPVVGLLDHLGVATASLCGVSLGGIVAAWVAAHHPGRVDRLVLACTAAHLPPASGWLERAAGVRAGGVAALLGTLVPRWFSAGWPDANPDAIAAVAAMLAGTDAEGYAGCCEALAAADLRPALASITAPTLVLAAAEDPVTPPGAGLELQAGIPGAALRVLPGVSHLAAVEDPAAFAAAVVEHLDGEPLARGRARRRQVLGEAHVARSEAGRTAFNGDFVDFITRVAWGEVWTRPGLDAATRSAITLAALASLGRLEELALHVAAARGNGLGDAQIAEVLLHTAVYAGVPAANSAMAVAARVLAELDGGGGAGGGGGG